jgi:hypothetical protein
LIQPLRSTSSLPTITLLLLLELSPLVLAPKCVLAASKNSTVVLRYVYIVRSRPSPALALAV